MSSPSRRWLLDESGNSHAPIYGVPLVELLCALGVPTLDQLREVCPDPALLELPPRTLEGSGAVFFDADPGFLRHEATRRLQRVLAHPALGDLRLYFLKPERPDASVAVGNSLRFADVKLTHPDVEARHASFSVRGGLRRVMDLESRAGTLLEEGRLRTGIPLPVVGGQRVAFGRCRTLFLEPETLHLLTRLGARAAIRARFPQGGIPLRAALDVFQGLSREEVLARDLPPFLVEVPTTCARTPTGRQKTTLRLTTEQILEARRSKQAGLARLHLLGPRLGRDVAEGIAIGRGSDCDVQLPEGSVSKRHARLRVLPSGRYGLIDCDSNNGTFLNGERIPEGVPAPLDPDAQVWFSSYRALFISPEQAYDLVARLPRKKSA